MRMVAIILNQQPDFLDLGFLIRQRDFIQQKKPPPPKGELFPPAFEKPTPGQGQRAPLF